MATPATSPHGVGLNYKVLCNSNVDLGISDCIRTLIRQLEAPHSRSRLKSAVSLPEKGLSMKPNLVNQCRGSPH